MRTATALLLTFNLILAGISAKEYSFNGMLNGSYLLRKSVSSEIQLRYFPKISLGYPIGDETSIDFYFEPQISSRLIFRKGELSLKKYTRFRDYRAWMRFSRTQWEIRVGQQKINFGPARLLRSLKWFDQIDPRDPLALSKGMYGILARYYHLNNWNYWLWAVWQKDAGFYPLLQQQKNRIEWGGRLEAPLLKGNWGATVDTKPVFWNKDRADLNRVALDVRYDWHLGSWAEFVVLQWRGNSSRYQAQWTLGLDYTFPIQNGLYFSAEVMGVSDVRERLPLESAQTFGACQLNYPISLFNSVSFLGFWDWKTHNSNFTVTLTHQQQNIEWHIQALYDDWHNSFPGMADGQFNFGGNALMFILVFYH